MVGIGGKQIQLEEDVGDVLFHGALADHERRRDGRVGAAFGHQPEHFALALCELGQRMRVAAASEQLGDHVGSSTVPPAPT